MHLSGGKHGFLTCNAAMQELVLREPRLSRFRQCFRSVSCLLQPDFWDACV